MDKGYSSVIKPLSRMPKALGSVPSTYDDDDDNDDGADYTTQLSHHCRSLLPTLILVPALLLV